MTSLLKYLSIDNAYKFDAYFEHLFVQKKQKQIISNFNAKTHKINPINRHKFLTKALNRLTENFHYKGNIFIFKKIETENISY